MATSDQEQKGSQVPQHKRMAAGEKPNQTPTSPNTPSRPINY